MKNYLEKLERSAEKELDDFKKDQDKKLEDELKEIDESRQRQIDELQKKQDQMFNWESKVRSEENKILSAFEAQKEALMKRKMEEQQREMLKEMSQADVDDMIRRHKEEIDRMNDAFRRE
eukprot:CAMPEP_0176343884 /NCGR_PEP_ID=MMETSP0126-20121128/4262_1 /TAXON_ID=141414 ORGANISM="Strombidinopsis acuminatum, Strain SPMC142" /NCGR_SAMPLE_ID=MMETSP0126 /ASSEMBLY_ACC=CAM_ASM_000229 /LENGTH=119 /DNA_ID=CAMNT_0017690023 /DNA_START=12116 /DNA_END=12475 /DNA_ORIENTATION=+